MQNTKRLVPSFWLGALGDEALGEYEFDRRSTKGVRNRLAHAYGDVSAEIIWEIIEDDFPKLIDGCRRYCDDLGLELVFEIDQE